MMSATGPLKLGLGLSGAILLLDKVFRTTPTIADFAYRIT